MREVSLSRWLCGRADLGMLLWAYDKGDTEPGSLGKALICVREFESRHGAVDGVLHEFKSLASGATSNTIRNSVNNSIKRGGQARNLVLDARGTGLARAEAEPQTMGPVSQGTISIVRRMWPGIPPETFLYRMDMATRG